MRTRQMKMRCTRLLSILGLAAVCCGGHGSAAAARAAILPPPFVQLESGPSGGTIWQGVIPNRFVAGATRVSIVYLPPMVTTAKRYPVLYVLHGLPGSPYSISNGLRFAEIADRVIASRRVRPFIAVMPVAGSTGRYKGEWTGPWENFVVHGVVSWVDRHLPTIASASGRAIAGVSAGGYGPVGLGVRHPRIFGTLEAWSGYFSPLRDGHLRHSRATGPPAPRPEPVAERAARLL